VIDPADSQAQLAVHGDSTTPPHRRTSKKYSLIEAGKDVSASLRR
jgi:hypothetical protein